MSLDFLCYIMPNLKEKSDVLLFPIMADVILTLRVSKQQETRIAAINFLRSFFKNTKEIHRFVEEIFELGLAIENPTSKIIFLHALSIIFDCNTEEHIFRDIIVHLAKELVNNFGNPSCYIIYNLLKHAHDHIEEEVFRVQLTGLAHFFYILIRNSEREDSTHTANCKTLEEFVEVYEEKCKSFHLQKVFSVVDTPLFNRIKSHRFEKLRSVRAVTMELYRQLKYMNVNNLPDLLIFSSTLIRNSQFSLQESGFNLLKDILTKMGFFVAPHLSSFIGVLRECLISKNTKIKSKTEKLLNKMMRSIHPMTVIWELFKTKDSLQKEAIMRLILKTLKCFPYYFFDLIALSKYISCHMQDQNSAIHRASHDCMIMLLSIMRATPVSDIQVEASRLTMQNYNLQRGIEQIVRELDDQDDVESISDDATAATLSTAQTSMTIESCVSLSAACSNATLQKVWKTDKVNPDSPTPSEILPQDQHRVFQPCKEKKSFSRMKSIGPGDSRVLATDIRHSHVDLPESKISLHRPKMSYLGEQTVESTCTVSSYAKSCEAKKPSRLVGNPDTDAKTGQSDEEFFQKTNEHRLYTNYKRKEQKLKKEQGRFLDRSDPNPYPDP